MAKSKTPLTDSPSAAHTPTPWHISNDMMQSDLAVVDYFTLIRDEGTDNWVAAVTTDGKIPRMMARANAELIVRAVNCHQELLEALKTLHEIRCKQWHEVAGVEFVQGRTLLPWPDLQQAEAAIKKAENGA